MKSALIVMYCILLFISLMIITVKYRNRRNFGASNMFEISFIIWSYH